MSADESIRSYWLTGQAAVGALHRTADAMVAICDIRRWDSRDGRPFGEEIFALSRLKGILGTNATLRKPQFREVVAIASEGMAPSQKLPVVRFPSWLHCANPECGYLAHLPWRDEPGSPILARVRCKRCDGAFMNPAPWVLVGSNGFLGDMDWNFLAHENVKFSTCETRTDLFLKRDRKTGRYAIECKACVAHPADIHDLEHRDFAQPAHVAFQPWDRSLTLGDWLKRHGATGGAPYETKVRALHLYDSRLHLPVTASAVDIPPESRKDPNALRYRILQHPDYEKLRVISRPKQLEDRLRRLAIALNAKPGEVLAEWDTMHTGAEPTEEYRAPETMAELYNDEYRAFCTDWGRMNSWERFLVKDMTEKWREFSPGCPSSIIPKIDRLVSVERLREVQVLRGFRRLGHEGPLVRPDLTGDAGWLPANELHGEGIFFTLDPRALAEWESNEAVCRRGAEVRQRFGKQPVMSLVTILADGEEEASAEAINPRFLLLHTLAHLLIRQLEYVVGVPAASIRERIYSSTGGGAQAMAGILLYTASQDRVGSLAGLSVIARPERFYDLLVSTIRRGAWCSFDPVCAEHEGTGPSLLNRAACHGCALLPEPSCCYSNLLLDRQFVVGHTPDAQCLPGYFAPGEA